MKFFGKYVYIETAFALSFVENDVGVSVNRPENGTY